MYTAALAAPRFAAIDLNQPGSYVHWSIFDVSVANLVLIAVMVVIFGAALLLPFPGRHRTEPAETSGSVTPDLDAAAAAYMGDDADAKMWTSRVRRWGMRTLPPNKMLPDRQPAYVASWIYVFGVATVAALILAIGSGLVIAVGGTDWWHTNPVGHFFNSMHLWSVELFMAFMVIHLWGKFWMAAWRGRRALTWITGVVAFVASVVECFTGYLSQQNFDSQWIATNGKDAFNAAGIGAFFNVMNFGQMLLWHVVLIPIILVALVGAHVLMVRVRGVSHPLPAKRIPWRDRAARKAAAAADAGPWRGRTKRYDAAQLPVDLVTRGQRLFQRHAADHVAQRGGGQLLDPDDVVADLVDGRLRVGDLEVDDGVDVERQVVFGDHRLRRERHNPLAQVDPGADPVDEWHQQGQLPADRAAVATQPFDHRRFRLRDQRHRLSHHDDGEAHQDGKQNQTGNHQISCCFRGLGIFPDHRCGPIDMHDGHLFAGFELVTVVQWSRGPHLTVHFHLALVAGHPVEHQRSFALQRLDARRQALRGGQMPAQGGSDQYQQQHGNHQENRAVGPDRQVQKPAGSGRGQRATTQHQQEHVAGQRLRAGQRHRYDQPDHGRRHAVRISRDRPCPRRTTRLRNHVVPQCDAIGLGQCLACRQGRARRCPRRVILLGTKTIGDRIRCRRGGPLRAAVAGRT